MEDSFLTGHLAVLLGLLCEDDFEDQKLLLDSLPGSTSSEKLDDMINHVESFAASYSEVLSHLSQSGFDAEMSPAPKDHVNDGNNVAHGVAVKLKAMKDSLL